MPVDYALLPEIEESVTRPIIFDIMRQVQVHTGMAEDLKVYYAGDVGKLPQAGSTIDDSHRDIRMESARYLFLEVEEKFDDNYFHSMAVTQIEHPPLFIDRALGLFIYPSYTRSSVEISVNYQTPSKTEAFRWMDTIRIRLARYANVITHSITYHYLLPSELLDLLQVIHGLRESVKAYGQDIGEYIAQMASPRLRVLGDLRGGSLNLGVSETQARILGLFRSEDLPDRPTRDDKSGTWSNKFIYTFTYDRPIACTIRYPIMIHNQLLPEKYLTIVRQYSDPGNNPKLYSLSNHSLSEFEPGARAAQSGPDDYPILPIFDDWLPPQVPPGTGQLFAALCELETDHPNTLLNLSHLGEMAIDSDVLTFIKESEYPYLGVLYDSILHLTLYRGNAMASSGTLETTAELDVSSVRELDWRVNHRVLMSLVTNIVFLKQSAIDRLRQYKDGLVLEIITNELIRMAQHDQKVVDLWHQRVKSSKDIQHQKYSIKTVQRQAVIVKKMTR